MITITGMNRDDCGITFTFVKDNHFLKFFSEFLDSLEFVGELPCFLEAVLEGKENIKGFQDIHYEFKAESTNIDMFVGKQRVFVKILTNSERQQEIVDFVMNRANWLKTK